MNFPRRLLYGAVLLLAFLPGLAMGQPTTVLWWNTIDGKGEATSAERQKMADYLDAFGGGEVFDVTYVYQGSQKQLARQMADQSYGIVVIDTANLVPRFSAADLEAVQRHYASGHKAIMLDGTLNIRSVHFKPESVFPGPGGSSAALLVNQVTALARAGGGVLIGTDHNDFQIAANQVVRALVPDAAFTGLTDPSTNGEFIGSVLLGEVVPTKAKDILRHWESIPSQGQAPVGSFTDFLGNPVEFYALVEAADKPGTGPMRPYISASFDPGAKRTAIDNNKEFNDHMPTRVGPGRAANQATAKP